MASKTTRNWPSYFFSSSLRRRASPLFEAIISRSWTNARIMAMWTSTHTIHDRFCCNRGFTAATCLHTDFQCAGGRARRSVGQHTVSSMPPSLAAPRARLAWRLRDFATNRHKYCGFALLLRNTLDNIATPCSVNA
jgi:hypothetical protein